MKKTAKTILSTTLVASLLAGAAVPVFAQPGGFGMERGEGPRMPIAFSNFDTDGDGAITQEEIDAKKTLRFTEMDANGDGQLVSRGNAGLSGQAGCRAPQAAG